MSSSVFNTSPGPLESSKPINSHSASPEIKALQENAANCQFESIDKFISGIRQEPNLESKWSSIIESCCELGYTELLSRLFEVRNGPEKSKLKATLKMVKNCLDSNSKTLDELIKYLPSEPDSNDILAGLPNLAPFQFNALLCRLCDADKSKIMAQLNDSIDAEKLVADFARYILESKQVNTESYEVQSKLRQVFAHGNLALGTVLMECGISFDWMESSGDSRRTSSSAPPQKFDRRVIFPKASRLSKSGSDHEAKKTPFKEPTEEESYMSMVEMYGVTQENMITYEDFEVLYKLIQSILNEAESVSSEQLPRKISVVRQGLVSPRLLVDPSDKIWTDFLESKSKSPCASTSTSIDYLDSKSVKKEKDAGWMEPSMELSSFSIVKGVDWVKSNEALHTGTSTLDSALYVGLGGKLNDGKMGESELLNVNY